MEPITRLLFEQPYLQAMIWAAAIMVALAGWWWARREGADSKGWAWALVAIMAVGIGGQVAQWAVVTDREQIRQQLDRAAAALEQADVAALMSVFDPAVVAQGQDYDQLAQWLERTLRNAKIRKPSVRELDVTFPGQNVAYATVSGIATVELSAYRGVFTGTWKMEFVRTGGVWMIVAIESTDDTQSFP